MTYVSMSKVRSYSPVIIDILSKEMCVYKGYIFNYDGKSTKEEIPSLNELAAKETRKSLGYIFKVLSSLGVDTLVKFYGDSDSKIPIIRASQSKTGEHLAPISKVCLDRITLAKELLMEGGFSYSQGVKNGYKKLINEIAYRAQRSVVTVRSYLNRAGFSRKGAAKWAKKNGCFEKNWFGDVLSESLESPNNGSREGLFDMGLEKEGIDVEEGEDTPESIEASLVEEHKKRVQIAEELIEHVKKSGYIESDKKLRLLVHYYDTARRTINIMSDWLSIELSDEYESEMNKPQGSPDILEVLKAGER